MLVTPYHDCVSHKEWCVLACGSGPRLRSLNSCWTFAGRMLAGEGTVSAWRPARLPAQQARSQGSPFIWMIACSSTEVVCITYYIVIPHYIHLYRLHTLWIILYSSDYVIIIDHTWWPIYLFDCSSVCHKMRNHSWDRALIISEWSHLLLPLNS